jgi:hypothetical protein
MLLVLSREMQLRQKSNRPYRKRSKRQVKSAPIRWEAPRFETLLARADTQLQCSYLPEPMLSFAGKQQCEDPRTGLTAFGPYSRTESSRSNNIRVGIVGPAEAIDRTVGFLSQLGQRIEPSGRTDAVLHPAFPGINLGEPFQIELVTQPIWNRPLKPKDLALIENHPDFMERIGLLLKAVITEMKALQNLDSRPDVVICAMSKSLEELCRVGIAAYDRQQAETDDGIDPEDLAELLPEEEAGTDDEEIDTDAARSFRRGLKAECLKLFPTQLMWHRTLAGTAGVQDMATRAWNLIVALLYKSEIIPWRLTDVIEGSCFVGVSFFHEDQAKSSKLRTSVAQAFTERGEGFVLQGDSFDWDSKESGDKAPHLNHDQAKALLKRVLKMYDDQIGGLPRKVVLHKTSRYTEEERKGFEAALEGVSHYGLLTITRRGIFCLRPGKKAALRGTVVDFGQKRGLVYTMGYVPFLRCYPGFRVPQPLEITENWGSVSLQEAAQDLLKLTKLNWNTAAFNCRDPITIAFSRRVGDILKMARGKDPALHYRYYM